MTTATDYLLFDPSASDPRPVIGTGYTPDGTIPADAMACTSAQAAAWQGSTIVGGAIVAPPVVAPTLAQQAQAALLAGVEIASTATPALSGTYACDPTAQAKLTSMYGLIQRAGGAAFPAGLNSLPWPDRDGTPHVFTSVADFLNLETAIGDYVLALDLIITTGAGTLPPTPVKIA